MNLRFLYLLPLALTFCSVVETATAQSNEETPSTPRPVGSNDFSGQWTGSWLSCKSGHRGKLRATFCRLNDRQLEAVFAGSFAKFLPFRYRAVLEIVEEKPGQLHLRGSKSLGPFMGTFSYEAMLTAVQFKATYQSKRDCGRWSLTRAPCH